MRYLIIAYDDDDPKALSRRQLHRPEHLKNATQLQHDGHLLIGGAILNDAGQMIGTAAVADFETRDELDNWLESDPYTKGGVWKNITVLPYRVAEHYENLFQPDTTD